MSQQVAPKVRLKRGRIPKVACIVYWELQRGAKYKDIVAKYGLKYNRVKGTAHSLKTNPTLRDRVSRLSPCCFADANRSEDGFLVCSRCGEVIMRLEEIGVDPYHRHPTNHWVNGKSLGSMPMNRGQLNFYLLKLKKAGVIQSLAPWHLINIDPPYVYEAMVELSIAFKELGLPIELLDVCAKDLRKKLKALEPKKDQIRRMIDEILLPYRKANR